MTRSTYYAPLDPACPDVRAFHESVLAGEEAPSVWSGPEPVEEFERRHRAECERCHVYGAVNMQVSDA
jgi:hypothetical protein